MMSKNTRQSGTLFTSKRPYASAFTLAEFPDMPCLPGFWTVGSQFLTAVQALAQKRVIDRRRGLISEYVVLAQGQKRSLKGLEDLIDILGRVGCREKGDMNAGNDDAVIEQVKIELPLRAPVFAPEIALPPDFT